RPAVSVTLLRPLPLLPAFPTRRSSDLGRARWAGAGGGSPRATASREATPARDERGSVRRDPPASSRGNERAPSRRGRSWASCRGDRKSTRLNSSHEWISYAVFCLKKKK